MQEVWRLKQNSEKDFQLLRQIFCVFRLAFKCQEAEEAKKDSLLLDIQSKKEYLEMLAPSLNSILQVRLTFARRDVGDAEKWWKIWKLKKMVNGKGFYKIIILTKSYFVKKDILVLDRVPKSNVKFAFRMPRF